MRRCFRLTAAVGFTRAQLGDAISAQALTDQTYFRFDFPNWFFCRSFGSIPPGPWGVLWQEMGENLLMSISKVSDLESHAEQR